MLYEVLFQPLARNLAVNNKGFCETPTMAYSSLTIANQLQARSFCRSVFLTEKRGKFLPNLLMVSVINTDLDIGLIIIRTR
jgi:hypothetical protein